MSDLVIKGVLYFLRRVASSGSVARIILECCKWRRYSCLRGPARVHDRHDDAQGEPAGFSVDQVIHLFSRRDGADPVLPTVPTITTSAMRLLVIRKA